MDIQHFIKQAIAEDIQEGDHTSLACIPSDKDAKAEIIAKENGIIAGLGVAEQVFKAIDPELDIEDVYDDGNSIEENDMVMLVHGKAQSILKGERLALNFLQRMSGIATLTHQFVEAVKGYDTKITDTRKTTPLFREFEKMAVIAGGGVNHRFGLYDMILIKDNHIRYSGGITSAIVATHEYLDKEGLELKIEVETASLDDVGEVLSVGGVDRIMLDNFTPEEVEAAVQLINGTIETEVSGGITLETVKKYAACGVDFISVGALTHSSKNLDLSLQAI